MWYDYNWVGRDWELAECRCALSPFLLMVRRKTTGNKPAIDTRMCGTQIVCYRLAFVGEKSGTQVVAMVLWFVPSRM